MLLRAINENTAVTLINNGEAATKCELHLPGAVWLHIDEWDGAKDMVSVGEDDVVESV
jgi:hypothetical protein